MKTTQRDNITKERQARLATGGGPPPAEAEVDPEIAEIIPSLMKTVPTVFSSNISVNLLEGMQLINFFFLKKRFENILNLINIMELGN